mmetsp:Transcript_13302/g.31479  ORF Transcript_13302/g.31479 Transcript_13302/m.31479 type:complete len:326 (-) Transcript_13302:224-1201(-)
MVVARVRRVRRGVAAAAALAPRPCAVRRVFAPRPTDVPAEDVLVVRRRQGRRGRRQGRRVVVAAAAEQHALDGRAALAHQIRAARVVLARRPVVAALAARGRLGHLSNGQALPELLSLRPAGRAAGRALLRVRHVVGGGCEGVGVLLDLVVLVELVEQQQAGPRRRCGVRVAQVGPANTRVGAAGELAAEVVLLVGGDVTAQHRGGHHAVDAEQVLDRVGRGLDLRAQVPGEGAVPEEAAEAAHGHARGGRVLPLDTVAPRGEAHAVQHGAASNAGGDVADEVSVGGPQPFGLGRCRLDQGRVLLLHGEGHRRSLALRDRVGVRQ